MRLCVIITLMGENLRVQAAREEAHISLVRATCSSRLSVNLSYCEAVVSQRWFPVHIERVIAETIDVLRQVRANACQSLFWDLLPGSLKLPPQCGSMNKCCGISSS
jgi:hypothetical protein